MKRRISQAGPWEQGILCPKCDERLGVFDDYAYEVLPEVIDQKRVLQLRRNLSIYEVGVINVEKFRMFLVSLLWRAGRSSQPMFKGVKLGPYDRIFEDILTGRDRTRLSNVDCVFCHFMPPQYDKLLFPPFGTKQDGVNVIQFYLYPWKLLIKLDQRPFSRTFQQTTLKPNGMTHALMVTNFSEGEVRMLIDLQEKIKAAP